jgi:phage baseplate assembly protein W
MIDGLEAAAQAIDLILSTERFRHSIFSTDYGAELDGLIGKSKSLIRGDIKRRVEEALKQDDRVVGVTALDIGFEREVAHVRLTVKTIFGDVERSVTIG